MGWTKGCQQRVVSSPSLRLGPDNRISGDKLIGKGRLPTNNQLTIALKRAASTLRTSQTYLGVQFRRLRTKLGAPVAINAMAAKLARLVYRMLRYGMKFVDRKAEVYAAQRRSTPEATNQSSQVESRQAGISHHRSSCSLKAARRGFLEIAEGINPALRQNYFASGDTFWVCNLPIAFW
jgi:hypothetical protein